MAYAARRRARPTPEDRVYNRLLISAAAAAVAVITAGVMLWFAIGPTPGRDPRVDSGGPVHVRGESEPVAATSALGTPATAGSPTPTVTGSPSPTVSASASASPRAGRATQAGSSDTSDGGGSQAKPGLTDPSALTPYTGPDTISGGTHVLTNMRFGKRLTIRGGNVTIRNSSFAFRDYYLLLVEGGKVTVEHSEFDGTGSKLGDVGATGPNLTIRYSTFKRLENAMRVGGGSLVEHNVIGSPKPSAGHTEGIGVYGGSDIIIRHNVVDIRGGGGPAGAIGVESTFGSVNNVTVESNEITGGAYPLCILRNADGTTMTNVRVRNNRLHGPYTFAPYRVEPRSAVVEWTGNTVDGRPLDL